jgi:hypothetical protein
MSGVFVFEYSYSPEQNDAQDRPPEALILSVTIEVRANAEDEARRVMDRYVFLANAARFHRVGNFQKQIIFHSDGPPL